MKKKILIIGGVVLVLAIAIFTYLYQTYDIPKKTVEVVHTPFRAKFNIKDEYKMFITNMDELNIAFEEIMACDYAKGIREVIGKYNEEFFEENILFIAPYKYLGYKDGDILTSYINFKNELIIESESVELYPYISKSRPGISFPQEAGKPNGHAYEIPKEVADRYNLSAEKIKIKYIPKYVTREQYDEYYPNWYDDVWWSYQ